MGSWDERFRAGDYPRDPDPSPVLGDYVETASGGRALDVATGTGRNAVYLATAGYDVDALDRSREGLRIARENAAKRGIDVDWIRADATEFEYPGATYDLVTISYFRTLDRLPDVKQALKPGGVLFYEHHLRSSDPVEVGPGSDRHRFAANELLRACLDLTVLHYDETARVREDGRVAATARILARNTSGPRQSYPTVEDRD